MWQEGKKTQRNADNLEAVFINIVSIFAWCNHFVELGQEKQIIIGHVPSSSVDSQHFCI